MRDYVFHALYIPVAMTLGWLCGQGIDYTFGFSPAPTIGMWFGSVYGTIHGGLAAWIRYTDDDDIRMTEWGEALTVHTPARQSFVEHIEFFFFIPLMIGMIIWESFTTPTRSRSGR